MTRVDRTPLAVLSPWDLPDEDWGDWQWRRHRYSLLLRAGAPLDTCPPLPYVARLDPAPRSYTARERATLVLLGALGLFCALLFIAGLAGGLLVILRLLLGGMR